MSGTNCAHTATVLPVDNTHGRVTEPTVMMMDVIVGSVGRDRLETPLPRRSGDNPHVHEYSTVIQYVHFCKVNHEVIIATKNSKLESESRSTDQRPRQVR